MDHRQQRRIGRIGLLGAECSGKSSLARALESRLPACVVEEELRDFVDRHGRTPRREEQLGLIRQQAAREERMAASCDLPWLVADPAPLMTAVYSVHYFDDDSLLTRGITHAEGYALLVWCAPTDIWQPDGLHRDGPDVRRAVDDVLTDLLNDGPASSLPWLRVTGTEEERVMQVLTSLPGNP